MAKKRFGADIDSELLKKVKAKIALSGITINKLITDFLTQWVK